MDKTRQPQQDISVARRAVTVPTALQANLHHLGAADTLGASSAGSSVETLYSHPDVKIISFAATSGGPRRASDSAFEAPGDAEGGALAWSSRLERIIAVGPFRVYRAPGSVAFLSCGAALQPILPKSQCWCIDQANSKFVLQIRRPNYWRIELPVSNSEDQKRARDLRDTLDRVLQFEKTQCPFRRPFTVELPEKPTVPVKKKPWSPLRADVPPAPLFGAEHFPSGTTRTRHPASNQDGPTASERRDSHEHDRDTSLDLQMGSDPCGVVTRWPCEKSASALLAAEPPKATSSRQGSWCEKAHTMIPAAAQLSPGCDEAHRNNPGIDAPTPSSTSSATRCPRRAVPDVCSGMVAVPQAPSSHHEESLSGPLLMRVASASSRNGDVSATISGPSPSHAGGFGAGRSFTSPPQLTLVPSNFDAMVAPDFEPWLSAGESPSGSQDSFHSAPSWTSSGTPPPASPLVSRSGPYIAQSRDEGSDDCNYTPATNPSSLVLEIESHIDPKPRRAKQSLGCAVPDDAQGNSTGVAIQRTTARPRVHATGKLVMGRNTSPSQPQAKVLDEPQHNQTMLGTVTRLPRAIIVKTCELLLGPPCHLVALMLKVASKICAGEWRGRVDGYGERGERIPVQWDYVNGELSDWTDDDEIPVSQHPRQRVREGSVDRWVDGFVGDGRTDATAEFQHSSVD